jgi:hypothetical protein
MARGGVPRRTSDSGAHAAGRAGQRLPDAAEAERMKTFWRERVGVLEG